MTPIERADVAREVTGQKWERPKGKSIVILGRNGSYADIWDPGFTGGPFKRSQALALVEWLADKIQPLSYLSDPVSHEKFHSLSLHLLEAIRTKDTAALEQLVLDLRGKDG